MSDRLKAQQEAHYRAAQEAVKKAAVAKTQQEASRLWGKAGEHITRSQYDRQEFPLEYHRLEMEFLLRDNTVERYHG